MSEPTFYYELINGTYYLMDSGSIREFRSQYEMGAFVSDAVPEGNAVMVEVTRDNWQELYDSGVFF